jgi:GTP-binding protein HflX
MRDRGNDCGTEPSAGERFVTTLIQTARRERALLVGVAGGRNPLRNRALVEDALSELSFLADSAGARVIHRMIQERPSIDPAYFVGRGKAQEIAWLVQKQGIDIVIFDDDLSAVQIRNLEKLITCKILDRSGLILDIFAARAHTNEAKTQVELAQLQYALSRLTRQWTHLSKQFGGIGTKGPGETQIETDRRVIRRKISRLKGKLRTIGKEREIQRKGREQFPRIALVGYTNAGKSTIMNWMSGAGVLAEDLLFATLDSTVRLVELTPARRILLSDTVGFIRDLPHHLVASFKSSLDEVREADVLLHVIDVSHPLYQQQIAIVNETLEDIGAGGKPTIMVFNKVDQLGNRNQVSGIASQYDHAVFVSATRSINMSALTAAIASLLEGSMVEETMTFGQDQYSFVAQVHDTGEVLEKWYEDGKVTVRFRMNRTRADQLRNAIARKRL